MLHTYLLMRMDVDLATINELMGTFDTPELAQEFVEQSTGEDPSPWTPYPHPDPTHWEADRWRIARMPHNGTDPADWVEPYTGTEPEDQG